MNCTDFENVVVGIARREIMDAEAHRDALAHVTACARCARRLANEQALTGVVAAVVAEDSMCAAPPAVESRLLAAFRQRQTSFERPWHTWLTRAVAGAAAAMLIMAVILVLRRPEGGRPVGVVSVPRKSAPSPVNVIAPVYRETPKPPVRPLRAARRRPAAPPKTASAATQREIMTDFIPVVYDPEPVENGRVVRVRLPRSALVTFGLPVNELHAEEPIQADVLLGEDGLARAVRFVK